MTTYQLPDQLDLARNRYDRDSRSEAFLLGNGVDPSRVPYATRVVVSDDGRHFAITEFDAPDGVRQMCGECDCVTVGENRARHFKQRAVTRPLSITPEAVGLEPEAQRLATSPSRNAAASPTQVRRPSRPE